MRGLSFILYCGLAAGACAQTTIKSHPTDECGEFESSAVGVPPFYTPGGEYQRYQSACAARRFSEIIAAQRKAQVEAALAAVAATNPGRRSYAISRTTNPPPLTDDPFADYLAQLQTSDDPVLQPLAHLLSSLVRDAERRVAECVPATEGPARFAVIGRANGTERIIAGVIEIGLSKKPAFRASRIDDQDTVLTVREQEHKGHHDDKTLQPVDAFAGVHLIGIVAVSAVSPNRGIVTVHLTCARTLVDVAAAQMEILLNDGWDAESATKRPAKGAAVADPLAACLKRAAPGDTRAWACCLHPRLAACQSAR